MNGTKIRPWNRVHPAPECRPLLPEGLRRGRARRRVFLLTALAPVMFLAVGWSVGGGGSAPDPDSDVAPIEVTGEGRQYWSRWRGPSGQGVAVGSGYPDTWSDEDHVLWKVELPGRGNSSPIVWDERIFLTTAYDGGRRRAVLSLRRSDGKILWQTFAPQADPERAYPKNGHASSTPATDGEAVYAYLGNHGLLSLDFDGEILWHRDLGVMPTRHGTAGSPLLYRDRVILYQDHGGPSGSFVAAFDKKTGETLWRTSRQAQVGWGSAVAIRVGDHDEIIVSGQRTVHAYDPDTGRELWTCQGNLSEVTPTPVVGQGLVFCTSGRAGPTLAIRPGGSGDVTDTHLAWSTSRGSPFIPSPLLYGEYLYTINDMVSVASCFEARTGKLLWQGRLGDARREGFSASPVGVDGKVFFTNDEGETFVLKAGPTFELLHVNRLNARTLASPALVDGRWYFRTQEHLLAIGHDPASASTAR